MFGIYDDQGIRFEYPPGWEVEVTDDGPRRVIAIESPDGPAFAMITVDENRLAPADMADEALAAMRDEYPTLEAVPALDSIDGQNAVGFDVEFFSLDMLNACSIRCFRTPRRTVLIFGQWMEDDEDDPGAAIAAIARSIEETDA